MFASAAGGLGGDILLVAAVYAVNEALLVLCCGQLGQEIAEGAGSRGHWFESRQALAKALPELIEEGDIVLVKASRGMHLEEISELLKTM